MLNDKQKIILRQPLYNLINEFNKTENINIELYDFFISYFNLNFLSKKIKGNLTEKLSLNLQNYNGINITYPNTYFDDMNTGLDKLYFNNNIFIYQKEFIDAASVTKKNTFFKNYNLGKNEKQLFINDINNILTLNIKYTEKINIFNCSFFLKDNQIHCSYKNNNNDLIIKKNSVGRKNFGLSQLLQELNDYINNINKDVYKNKYKNKYKNINTNTKNHLTKILLTIRKKPKIYNNLKNEIFNINDINEIKVDNKKIKIVDVVILFKYYLSNDSFNIKNIDNSIEDYIFDFIFYNNEMYHFIDYKNIRNVLKFYKDNPNIISILTELIYGAKRFGDWFQVYLSKKYNFMIQTEDILCKIYAYFYGAPVILNLYKENYLFNYKNNNDRNMENFRKIHKNDNKIKLLSNNDKLVYTSLNNIKTNVNRFYFYKYIKYKKKYLKLKNTY